MRVHWSHVVVVHHRPVSRGQANRDSKEEIKKIFDLFDEDKVLCREQTPSPPSRGHLPPPACSDAHPLRRAAMHTVPCVVSCV